MDCPGSDEPLPPIFRLWTSAGWARGFAVCHDGGPEAEVEEKTLSTPTTTGEIRD